MADSPVVSVYGSAGVHPGHPTYQAAEELGRLLGAAGYRVLTGGYGGVMEAASKGAHEAGGHVIGVTVALFERTGRRSGPNPYIDELITYDLLSDRLLHVVKYADAAVACGGGIGTLSEVTLLWSLMQTGEKAPIPFVLLGKHWDAFLRAYFDSGEYVRPGDMDLVRVAHTPAEALRLIQEWG
ncbi:MAG: hypothetical protein Kow00124_11740 [Anaerolineae bacterium]